MRLSLSALQMSNKLPHYGANNEDLSARFRRGSRRNLIVRRVFCGGGGLKLKMKMNSSKKLETSFQAVFPNVKRVVTYQMKITVAEYISLSVRLEIIIM